MPIRQLRLAAIAGHSNRRSPCTPVGHGLQFAADAVLDAFCLKKKRAQTLHASDPGNALVGASHASHVMAPSLLVSTLPIGHPQVPSSRAS
eukprot:3696626-Prymnesium_polylepis.1